MLATHLYLISKLATCYHNINIFRGDILNSPQTHQLWLWINVLKIEATIQKLGKDPYGKKVRYLLRSKYWD